MDARTKLPIEDTIDVCRSEFRVVGKQVVNRLLNLCKAGGCILKLKQLLDAKELTAFEDSFVLVVDNDISIRCVSLTDKDQTDTELTLHVSCKFILVCRQVAVLLQDGT